jgi:FtsP/CotA-like multicopper oxidase with cupredoxin domain
MAGPVVGITVTGKSAETATRGSRRALRLIARVDAGSTSADPSYSYALERDNARNAPSSTAIGPTLILKRGEPVSITIANQLPEDTSVHWHGIELESYFDGVPGFAGDGSHIAPPIPPGGSFIARFTPPRSGTFIYHAHVDDTRQQRAGLAGPLLIVDDPRRFDPAHDVVLMVTTPRKLADAEVVFINGSATPPAREMHVGQHYRLRLINLHVSRPSMRLRLLHGDTLLSWRALAKDGMDLPNDQRLEGRAEVQMGNGETYDFEVVPSETGDVRFDVTTGAGVHLATMPIHVTAAPDNKTARR